MKHAANILTGLRIAMALSLPAFFDNRTVFFIIFAAAGLTDLLDGIVARRTGTASKLGAKLDSFADLLLFGIMVACVIAWAGSALWALVPYIAAVAGVRIGSLGIAAHKFHAFAVTHTWGNKLTGVLIFVSFGAYILTDSVAVLIPVIVVAGLAALEEALILLTSSVLELNRTSLFVRQKDTKENEERSPEETSPPDAAAE
jgi:CDP-diacylglycerol--glycerol-3-phosphate 3-phosphatidyltransferase